MLLKWSVSSSVSVLSFLSSSFWKSAIGMLMIITSVSRSCCSVSSTENVCASRLYLSAKSFCESLAFYLYDINMRKFIIKLSFGSCCSRDLPKIMSSKLFSSFDSIQELYLFILSSPTFNCMLLTRWSTFILFTIKYNSILGSKSFNVVAGFDDVQSTAKVFIAAMLNVSACTQ